jgi:hypothetical protein
MPFTRRVRRIILAVLALAVLVPAVVLAAAPKTGVYIDTKLQVYVDVRGNPPHVKHFQGPCLRTPQGGGDPVQSGGFEITKHLKITKKRKFSFKGKATLHSFDDSRVGIKLDGRFKGGKAKGTVKFTDSEPPCDAYTFTAKYYGKHPQG